MVALVYSSIRTTWVLSQIKSRDGVPSPPLLHRRDPFESQLTSFQRDSMPFQSSQTPPSPSSPSPSSSSRISPAVLFIIVILAVIFFISGLLHLLVRFLVKKRPFSSSSSRSNAHQAALETSGSDTLQRQLQQLFHLHDAGLDQAFIDALPVFLYSEIVGTKEPFDCAVCLCEFSAADPLRLLPVCGHAFHLNCIDTWLLSNSTCPLCRGALFIPGLPIENPMFDFEDPREEEGSVADREPAQKLEDLEEIVVEKRLFPVRLGKFRSSSNTNGVVGGDNVSGSAICNARIEEGESSSSNLDARRCYSMGSYQYILGDVNLQVELKSGRGRRRRGLSGNIASDEGVEGKRLCIGNKGESLSVSKIWLWSNKKGKFPISSDADGGLPWMARGIGDT